MEVVCREFHRRSKFVKIPGIISPIARKVVIIFKYLALKRDTQSTYYLRWGAALPNPTQSSSHPLNLASWPQVFPPRQPGNNREAPPLRCLLPSPPPQPSPHSPTPQQNALPARLPARLPTPHHPPPPNRLSPPLLPPPRRLPRPLPRQPNAPNRPPQYPLPLSPHFRIHHHHQHP